MSLLLIYNMVALFTVPWNCRIALLYLELHNHHHIIEGKWLSKSMYPTQTHGDHGWMGLLTVSTMPSVHMKC